MLRYVLMRVGYALVTIWFVATVTFFAMHVVPGDPLANEKAVPPLVFANLRAHYGLDKPLATQYVLYLGNLARGDFGVSYTQHNRAVNDIIRDHFAVSATLGIFALTMAFSGALLMASVAALFHKRWPDRLTMLTVLLAVSVPGFVFAALAQLVILQINQFFNTSLLPVAGWGTGRHLLAPGFVLGLGTMAYLTRLLRGSLIDAGNQPYMLAARARGLAPWRQFFRYQLRNALLPVLAVMGPMITGITTGGFVVEQVFAIPGLGRYFIQAVAQLDYTVIMGTTVFYGSFLVLMVLVFDLLYGLADPRIRLGRSMA